MNTPGTTSGNWTWRFRWEQLDADLAGPLPPARGDVGAHLTVESPTHEFRCR